MSTPITTRNLLSLRLKEARLAAGLTQEKLGTLAGLSIDVARMRINRYERGTSEPNEATARTLAKALQIPLASLYAETPAMAQVIEAIAQLPAREQKKVAEELMAKVAARRSKKAE